MDWLLGAWVGKGRALLHAGKGVPAGGGPAERNYVLTHAVSDPGGHALDWVVAGRILWVAEQRRASLLVVRLTCGEERLRERIGSEERSRRFKTRDAGRAPFLAALAPFPINHDWVLDIDTCGLSAADTSDRIVAELAPRLKA